MAKPKILIVEDEAIVAKNLQNRLRAVGYAVPAIASSGEEALRKVKSIKPDLVLMDIVLNGEIDGIAAANTIHENYNTPVVFLTAYSDEDAIQRAKIAEPYGYILKPFEISEVHSAIEIALYKHEKEETQVRQQGLLSSALQYLNSAIVVTDLEGRVQYMNSYAENTLALGQDEALGKEFMDVLQFADKDQSKYFVKLFKNAGKVLPESENVKHTVRVIIAGEPVTISINVASIEDSAGHLNSILFVFHEWQQRRGSDGVDETHGSSDAFKYTEDMGEIPLMVASSSVIVHEGIQKLLEFDKNITINSRARSCADIISYLPESKPDILLIDQGLQGLNLGDVMGCVKSSDIGTRVILLLHDIDEHFIMKSISLGVRGFIRDATNPHQFIEGIKRVKLGEIWAEMNMLTKILTQVLPEGRLRVESTVERLTKREREIVKLVSKGYSNKKIAVTLSISEKTVKTHMNNIFKKLNVTNRFQLAVEYRM